MRVCRGTHASYVPGAGMRIRDKGSARQCGGLWSKPVALAPDTSFVVFLTQNVKELGLTGLLGPFEPEMVS